MGHSRITVGGVEISHLYDLVAGFPFPRTLDQAFPAVPAEAWDPYRREYPGLFGPGNVPRFHAGCYLIRSLVGDAIGHPAQARHPDWGVIGPDARKVLTTAAGRHSPPPRHYPPP